MTVCRRCSEYDLWDKGCNCQLIGRVWHPDRGHTESDGAELWSKTNDAEWAIQAYMAQWDADQAYDASEEQALAFRPAAGGPVQYFTSMREMEPVYRVQEADDRERSRIRREQAKTIRRDREYMRRKRAARSAA